MVVNRINKLVYPIYTIFLNHPLEPSDFQYFKKNNPQINCTIVILNKAADLCFLTGMHINFQFYFFRSLFSIKTSIYGEIMVQFCQIIGFISKLVANSPTFQRIEIGNVNF